jgi:hypothetical protein
LPPSSQLCRQCDYNVNIDRRRVTTNCDFVIWHSVNRDIAYWQFLDRICSASSGFSDYNRHYQPPRKPNRNYDINYPD